MMANPLPGSKAEWETEAGINILQTSLTSDYAFKSGSKFSRRDFLQLRILHIRSDASELYSDRHLPKTPVKKIKAAFDRSEEIMILRPLLQEVRDIEKWNNASSRKAGLFGLPLGLLSLLAAPAQKSEKDSELSIPSKIITSPRVRKQNVDVNNIYAKLPNRLSTMSLAPPSTPTRIGSSHNTISYDTSRFDRFDNSDFDFLYSPSDTASTAQTKRSPNSEDLQAAIDSWKKEMAALTGDEQTVNACLGELIRALTTILDSECRFRHDRKPFQVLKQNAPDDEALYEAQVDGIILGPDCQDVESFVEVKRHIRALIPAVRLQEGAQMAAFVYSKGSTAEAKSWQWMVSMDSYEGYITIATYGQEYVDFLYGKPPLNSKVSFMTMREYGPFDLRYFPVQENHGLESFLVAIAVLMGLSSNV